MPIDVLNPFAYRVFVPTETNTFGMLMTSIGFISCAILGYYSYFEIGKLQNALYFIAVTILGLLMYMYQTRKNVNEK